MSSERGPSARTELRAATRSLMSSLDRGRSHLTRCLDALGTGTQKLGQGEAVPTSGSEPGSYGTPTALSRRTRYMVQEGEGQWGGRVLNPSGQRSPSLASPPVSRRRRKRQKGWNGSSPTDSAPKSRSQRNGFGAPVGVGLRRTVPCRCFPVVPLVSDSEPRPSPSSVLAEASPTSPQPLLSSPGGLSGRELLTPETEGDKLLARLRSGGNVRRKSVSYERGPPSFAFQVPDLSSTSSEVRAEDEEVTFPPDSDWTMSGRASSRSASLDSQVSGVSLRGRKGRPSTTTTTTATTLGSGVLPDDDFWTTRPRTLLGYDFIAGCLDNEKALGERGALDWNHRRAQNLLRDWNALHGKSGKGRHRSSSLPSNPSRTSSHCLHRYRQEAEGRGSPARSLGTSRSRSPGRGSAATGRSGNSEDQRDKSPDPSCRLCRLLWQEKRRSACYHSCETDVPREAVACRSPVSSRTGAARSDMTFRPESLALSQNCFGRGSSPGVPRRLRASSVPRKEASRWRV